MRARVTPGTGSEVEALSIAATAADQTLSLMEQTTERFTGMLNRGYGPAFLAFGFVTVFATIGLRLFRTGEITTTVFISLLVLGLVLVAMSFAFLYMDARASQEVLRTVAEHNERVTVALLEHQKTLQYQQESVRQDLHQHGRDFAEEVRGLRNPAGPQ